MSSLRRRRHSAVAFLTSVALAFLMIPAGVVAEELDSAAEQLAEQQAELVEAQESEEQAAEASASNEGDVEAEKEAEAEREAEAATEEAQAETFSETIPEEPSLATQGTGFLIARGTCGTCPWSIDIKGALTIGAGTLASNDENDDEFWPWYQYGEYIRSATVSEDTKLSG